MVVDPACGTLVDERYPADVAVYLDRHYCFCSAECRAAFERNPSAFAGVFAEHKRTDRMAGGRPSTLQTRVARGVTLSLGCAVAGVLGIGLLLGDGLTFTLSGVGLIVLAVVVLMRVRPCS